MINKKEFIITILFFLFFKYGYSNTCYIEKDWHKGLFSEKEYQNLINNEKVIKYIIYYTNSSIGQEYLIQAFQNAKKYFGIIYNHLKVYNLPKGIAFLPVIESAYNPNAISKSFAVGIWQLMENTAKWYNLKITDEIDERKDPIKSTYIAIHHLSTLYDTFHSWQLAILAYNSGAGYLKKQIKKYKTTKFEKLYPYLYKETREYLPKFIAIIYIANNLQDYPFLPPICEDNFQTTIKLVKGGAKLWSISKKIKVNYEKIKELNPELISDKIPDFFNLYPLILPHNP
jgi:membrane-bound lytic murein transglycosylase D